MVTIIIQLLLNLIFLNPEAQKTEKDAPIENQGTNDDLATSTFGGTSTWTEGG